MGVGVFGRIGGSPPRAGRSPARSTARKQYLPRCAPAPFCGRLCRASITLPLGSAGALPQAALCWEVNSTGSKEHSGTAARKATAHYACVCVVCDAQVVGRRPPARGRVLQLRLWLSAATLFHLSHRLRGDHRSPGPRYFQAHCS